MKKFFIPLEIILRRFAARVTAWGDSRGNLNIPRIFLTGFIFVAISLGVFVGFSTGASSPFDITFPIPELDNCADRDACKTFCDDLAHKDACFAFAKKHGLVDANAEERIKNLPPTGPGGCNSEESCKTYCDDADHQEECIAFAEEHGLMTHDEAARNRKLATGPGGCQGEKECKEYCEEPLHQDECFEFAVQNGFIDKKEAGEFKKQREQFKKLQDESPGGCKNEQECRVYCEDSAHTDECVKFAEEHGFMSREEAARIRKVGIAGGPGGCKGEKECHAYCEDPVHQIECIDFAEQNGFMSKEEAARARKFIGKTGPGGCRGEECRNYCNDPAHQEECLSHAEREGLLPRDEIERIRKFTRAAEDGGPGGCTGNQCRDYCMDPAHQDECFEFAKKNGLMRPDEEKEFERGKKIQEKVRESGGPGGCRDDEACRIYCTDSAHTEECVAYAVAHGGMTEAQAREMLRHFLEQKFQGQEQFHPSGDFQQFQEGSAQRFEEFRQLEENFRGKFEGKFPGGMPQGFDGKNRMFEQRGMMQGGGEGRSMQSSDMHFAGPGGCTTPDECIKYCTEHKDECFQFGPPGMPSRRPPEGGIPPGEGGRSQIRTDIVHEFRPSDLPEGFDQMSHDQREEFFRSKFGGRPDEMRMMQDRGEPPQGFRGFEHGSPPFPQGRPEGEQRNFPDPLHERQEFPSDMSPEARERLLQQMREKPEMFGPYTAPPESGRAPFEGIGPVPGTPGIFGPMHMPPEGFNPSQETFYPTEQFRPPDAAQFPAQYPQEGTQNYYPPQQGQYQYVPHEGEGTTYPSQYPTEPQMISPPVTGDSYIPPPVMPPTITPESSPVAPPSMPPSEGSFSPPPPPPGAEAPSLEDFLATILLIFLR